MFQLFSDFAGNSRARKPNKSQTNWSNITYNIIARINRWFQLCIVSFILFSFYFLNICANFPFCVRLCHWRSTPPPPARAGIRKSNTASPPTSDKDLAAADPLYRPPLLRRCVCRHSCFRLQRRLSFPRLWIFFAATDVYGERQSRPIWCRLC